jgi:hypothetical protein
MNNQEIIDNAPDGAEFTSSMGYLWNDNEDWFIYGATTEEWNHLFFHEYSFSDWKIRSLADIKRIVELEKPHDEIDPLLKELLYCCDGLYCDYAQDNYGDAKNWLRHIDAAYGKYRDAIDDLEALKEPKT